MARTSNGGSTAEDVTGSRELSTSEVLENLWTSVLGVAPANHDEDLFDLGATSLAVVRLIGRVRDQFGVEVPLDELFRIDVTITNMAGLIDDLMEGRHSDVR
ncbi:acyl carrier protein [Verrucosispora sp. WMMD573]|uniref:acyl carrier protein n=1 Tax=Verrucosispora sp. WMMD573 TaxID=3015149 RepID=UPI00248AF6EA|nr:acyl carrier protein [Verrucosispora sp. WMMD573]WBB53731.1 acyl carrier protein [Verrucosispora sp. WMMD573]